MVSEKMVSFERNNYNNNVIQYKYIYRTCLEKYICKYIYIYIYDRSISCSAPKLLNSFLDCQNDRASDYCIYQNVRIYFGFFSAFVLIKRCRSVTEKEMIY